MSITANGISVIPTIFPDGTSQIWKLCEELIKSDLLSIDWRFESEREIVDLFSLRQLLPEARLELYIPFLPYGRQDKEVENNSTFNLHTFAKLLNRLDAWVVETLDAHNPKACYKTISNFSNIKVRHLQRTLIDEIKPDVLVYPDAGARDRYELPLPPGGELIFAKRRNQLTGMIEGHGLENPSNEAISGNNFLIIDDICDGGATFISVAKSLRKLSPKAKINLFVTHGIFSKGREHLLKNGIDAIFTTNSISKNQGEGVIKV